mgnify:CR=1 FL=1
MKTPEPFSIYWVDSDPMYSLKEWKTLIDTWIEKYGEDAMLEADGGYNNVQMKITVKLKKNKKVKKK